VHAIAFPHLPRERGSSDCQDYSTVGTAEETSVIEIVEEDENSTEEEEDGQRNSRGMGKVRRASLTRQMRERNRMHRLPMISQCPERLESLCGIQTYTITEDINPPLPDPEPAKFATKQIGNSAVAVSPDGRVVAVGGWDGR
jgi:hypothetical protein